MSRSFETNVDSDGPFPECDMVHRYDHLLSSSEQEEFSRWLWHAKPGDTRNVGKIQIKCVEFESSTETGSQE